MLKNITTLFILFLLYNNTFAGDDIRGLKDPMVGFMDFIFYQFVILLLLVILYLFYRKKINKKKLKKLNKLKGPSRKKILIDTLKKLKKNSNKIDKSIFYYELNMAFRSYFDLIGVENSDILTLNDVKKLDLNKTLVNLFEKSYLSEFNDKKDTNNARVDIIDKLIKYIK